jgi:flagellar motor protein MotB
VAYLDITPRVGRSQGASIFWGLVSVFFAAAACFYYWKYHENKMNANVLRDQVLTLQEESETLNSQKDKLQANISDTESQLKSREDFLQEKETRLAEEESRLEALGMKTQDQSQQIQGEAVLVKKFNDVVHKLATNGDTDVVVRRGRPVLRVPDSLFFTYGGSVLQPEGKSMLNQIVQSLKGQMDNFELRIATFTDSDGESARSEAPNPPAAAKPGASNPAAIPAPAVPAARSHTTSSWELTGERAAAIAHYLRDNSGLAFQNVVVVPRGDFQPVIASGKEGHARNRRVEITIAPVPASFHPPDPTTHREAEAGSDSGTPPASTNSTPPSTAAKEE